MQPTHQKSYYTNSLQFEPFQYFHCEIYAVEAPQYLSDIYTANLCGLSHS